MNDDKNPLNQTGQDGSPAVENAEVKIADAMGMLAELLRGLHKQGPMGETVDVTTDEDKNALIEKVASAFAKLGASEEDVAKLKDTLSDLAYEPDEHQEDKPEGEDEDIDQTKEPEDELDDFAKDALKACGFDNESPEFQRAFAEGVRYGEKKEKEEPKKLDSEHEREGEEKALAAQDAAFKRFERKMDAMAECSNIIGKVRAAAFDSADDVYMAALKQLGFRTKNIKPSMAQATYYGFLAGQKKAKKAVAQDSKPQETESDLLSKIKVRI